MSHVLGFTDIDNVGREGLELVYQDWLKAWPGKHQILRNRKGEVVEEISQVEAARPGKDLYTSIDMRLQYITSLCKCRVENSNRKLCLNVCRPRMIINLNYGDFRFCCVSFKGSFTLCRIN